MGANANVVIYDDPVTRRRPIGRARLISRIRTLGVIDGRDLELWTVRFHGDRATCEMCWLAEPAEEI